MKYVSLICLSILTATAPLCAQRSSSTKSVVVFQESGRFGGWPANNGMWAWGNEMLVGFSLAYFKNVERGHAVDPDKPSVLRFARSLDGGETWKVETPSFLTADGKEREPTDSPGGFDFTHPDSAVAFRMVSSRTGYSRFYYSSDRGKNWQGPYKIPTFDRTGIAARTDYIVNGRTRPDGLYHRTQGEWPRGTRIRGAHDRWRKDLELRFLDWTGAERLLYHAVVGQAFRIANPDDASA